MTLAPWKLRPREGLCYLAPAPSLSPASTAPQAPFLLWVLGGASTHLWPFDLCPMSKKVQINF